MEQTKKFKKTKKGLTVTVISKDKIFLPMADGSREFIGEFEQTMYQYITKDKVTVLRDFIVNEHNKGAKQLDEINKQLNDLKDITGMDEDLLKELQSRIGKGSKVFKQKMLVLNEHITKVSRKNQLIQQHEFISKEVDRLSKELEDINKAI